MTTQTHNTIHTVGAYSPSHVLYFSILSTFPVSEGQCFTLRRCKDRVLQCATEMQYSRSKLKIMKPALAKKGLESCLWSRVPKICHGIKEETNRVQIVECAPCCLLMKYETKQVCPFKVDNSSLWGYWPAYLSAIVALYNLEDRDFGKNSPDHKTLCNKWHIKMKSPFSHYKTLSTWVPFQEAQGVLVESLHRILFCI